MQTQTVKNTSESNIVRFCAASCRASGCRGQVPAGAVEEPLRGEAVSHHQPGERGQPLDRWGPLSGDVLDQCCSCGSRSDPLENADLDP